MIELGDRVKDKITGLKGIATGITDWLYGCRRIVVQPEEAKDGKPVDTFCVDEPQLTLMKKAAIAATPGTHRHGPRNDAQRRPDAVR